MILVDTSVWVDHFKRGNATLATLLDRAEVLTHPFVIGEIALGLSARRATIIDLLVDLPVLPVTLHDEVLNLVERRGLAGAGIGWVDAHLVASALIDRAPLWTLDRRLAAAAATLAVAWNPQDLNR